MIPSLRTGCALDPELEKASLIKLERGQAEPQKADLQVWLMALEIQRRQALLAAGTLTPFETLPARRLLWRRRPPGGLFSESAWLFRRFLRLDHPDNLLKQVVRYGL